MIEKTILLVLTERDGARPLIKRILRDGVKKVFLCPVDFKARNLPGQMQELLSRGSSVEFEVIDFVEEFNRTSFSLKDEYISFIHAISQQKLKSGKSVKEHFLYPGEQFSLWWFSLTAEKNQFRSHGFTLFSKVLTISRLQRAKGCQEIWCGKHAGILGGLLRSSGKQAGLWKELKIIVIEQLRVLRFTCNLLKKIIDTRNLRRDFSIRQSRLDKCDFALITNFPDLDEKVLREGKFVNLTYGSMQKAIEEGGNHAIAWFGIYASFNSSTWKKTLKLASSVKQAALFFMLEEWLTFSSFLRIIRTYIRSAALCLPILRYCRRLFIYRDSISGATFDFWAAHNKDFISSFLGKALFWNITYYTIFENLINSLHSDTKVLYFAEMHGWEKTLNVACSKRKDITSIGLQHTIVPLLLLNYFEHPEDLRSDNYLECVPTPKYLGCVGPVTRDFFLKGNWRKEKLFILGGFRFGHLKDNGDILARDRKRKNQLIVPFSISAVGNRAMMMLLYETFNDKDLDFTILLKPHPCYSMDKMIKESGLKINDKVFRFTNESLNHIVQESKLMIVKESSSVFWALYHKIPVIIPEFYDIVDLSPLSGISDLATYVKSPDELFKAVTRIMEEKYVFSGENYSEFLSSYLEVYPREGLYYSNLMRAIKTGTN